MYRQLRAIGVETLVAPESFYVKAMKKQGPLIDGEMERAVNWALGVQQRFEMLQIHLTAQ